MIKGDTAYSKKRRCLMYSFRSCIQSCTYNIDSRDNHATSMYSPAWAAWAA